MHGFHAEFGPWQRPRWVGSSDGPVLLRVHEMRPATVCLRQEVSRGDLADAASLSERSAVPLAVTSSFWWCRTAIRLDPQENPDAPPRLGSIVGGFPPM